ncbi:MAG: hypothetical protein KME32_05590 [Mojavia pulchra JT2-VF2]|jgi:hypothetical protein|uniref:Uncharacterized protein n=1 Tax=Mojavia pulchra JT2-VF2 TaxID=287848 RepID=A0A951PWW4_9NOST|nr:hypothetical protein [Mojavia pulchra JT2-VF2]
MADLETLLNELPNLVESLKLTVGDSQKISQEITRLNHVQAQLQNLQTAIAQELSSGKFNNTVVGVLSLTTAITVFPPETFFVDQLITRGQGFIAEKFGNTYTKLSLNDLQAQIERWNEWSELLQTIAKDILSDSQFINQINSNINYSSLPECFQKIKEALNINLEVIKPKKLQQQLQKIITFQEELTQIQERFTVIFNSIKNSHNILEMLLGLSAFCGNSGLELEWFNDEYGFIISSAGKFQPLVDIINDCEILKQKIDALLTDSSSLKLQAEQELINIEERLNKKQNANNIKRLVPDFLIPKVAHSTLAIASSLVIFGLGIWVIKHKIPQFQQVSLITEQERSAIANYKSAQKLGMEAAIMVQKPPLPLPVWQQAETKWQQAVNLLESIPEGTSVSTPVKKHLNIYRDNSIAISQRILTEKKVAANLKSSQQLATEAAAMAENLPHSALIRQLAKAQLQQAINLLEGIPEGTFVYKQAKDQLSNYKNNYKAISIKLKE